ncbi:MAG: hypothetical protein ABIG45_06920, partial [Bacillota bacterium]
MLGKLIKYEFKATARIFAPLFSALLIVSLINKLMSGLQLQAPRTISLVLSIILIAAAFVMTLILTIQRFYKNFMTNEGYLMFALPVGTGRLIWSKLIVAVVWTFVCTAVVYLSLSLMVFSGGEWHVIVQGIRELGLPVPDLTWFIIEFGALILTSLITGILTIYLSMALSMFSNRHRVALSVAFYIALNTVMQILLSAVTYLFSKSNAWTTDDFQLFLETNTL